MIIDHTHPKYIIKRKKQGFGKYNGAYYYSKDIVKHIIPKVKTDRNWITVRLEDELVPDHSIVFIHNNINPNYYQHLKPAKDLILVCSVPSTIDNMRFFGTPIYLPLSVDIKSIKKYCKKNKTKDKAFAGRRLKITNQVPKDCDILSDMSQTKLIKEMANYHTIYAVGRTAIQAKILGCKIAVYDERFPDPNFWKIIDSSEAAKMLQKMIDKIDRK